MGNLYIVATPIGNLQDISLRALKTLESVDFIACEDTRTTSILIKKYFETNPKQILDKMFSYYEQTEKQKIPHIVDMLLEGKNIALVSFEVSLKFSAPFKDILFVLVCQAYTQIKYLYSLY